MPDDKITEEEAEREDEASPEEFDTSGEFPSEDEMEMEIATAGADVGISPLDPDFILFALPFALFVDIVIDIPLEIIGHFFAEIPKFIGIAIDIVVFLILIYPGWMYRRLKKIQESKRERQMTLRRGVQRATQRLIKLRKIGRVEQKVFERYMRIYAKQLGAIGRAAARAARNPLVRTLIRGGLVLLGEIALIIGIIPFWTIGVILALREK